MSVEWIKMRPILLQHPKVLEMASFLKIDEFSVVGRLLALWGWLDSISTDGQHIKVASAFIDRLCGRDGFADALRSVAWLSGRDGDLSFPSYLEHNGSTAKSRAEAARRKERSRDAQRYICHGENGERDVEAPKTPNRKNVGISSNQIIKSTPTEGGCDGMRDKCHARTVTDCVTRRDKIREEDNISLSKGQADSFPSGLGDDLEKAREEGIVQCSSIGADPAFLQAIFPDWWSREGKDASGTKVPFARYAAKRWTREGEEWRQGCHTLQKKKIKTPADPSQRKDYGWGKGKK